MVTKSTVPVGTGRRLQKIFASQRPDLAIDVASNPGVPARGLGDRGLHAPGPGRRAASRASTRTDLLARCYRPLNLIETPILFTALETAELIKYATNAFLATKITFINEMADLCERVGADVQQVAKGMGLDGRIGTQVPACRPRLWRLLLSQGHAGAAAHRRAANSAPAHRRDRGQRQRGPQAAHGREDHPRPAAARCAGKTVAVLGVTFKPNTDDMRESPSLVIVPALQGEGAVVRAFDPEGMPRPAKLLPGRRAGATTPTHALEGADAAVILTEWNEFRGLDLERVHASRCASR